MRREAPGRVSIWASRMRPAQPPTTETDSSQDELSGAGLVPRRSRYDKEHVPSLLQVPGVIAVACLKLEPLTMSVGGEMMRRRSAAASSFRRALILSPSLIFLTVRI